MSGRSKNRTKGAFGGRNKSVPPAYWLKRRRDALEWKAMVGRALCGRPGSAMVQLPGVEEDLQLVERQIRQVEHG